MRIAAEGYRGKFASQLESRRASCPGVHNIARPRRYRRCNQAPLCVITVNVSVTETRCGFAGSKDAYHTHTERCQTVRRRHTDSARECTAHLLREKLVLLARISDFRVFSDFREFGFLIYFLFDIQVFTPTHRTEQVPLAHIRSPAAHDPCTLATGFATPVGATGPAGQAASLLLHAWPGTPVLE